MHKLEKLWQSLNSFNLFILHENAQFISHLVRTKDSWFKVHTAVGEIKKRERGGGRNMKKHDKHVGFPEILINMDNRRI